MRAKGQGGRCSASSLLTEGVFSRSFGSKLDLLFFLFDFKREEAPGHWGWECGGTAEPSRGRWLFCAEPYLNMSNKKELPWRVLPCLGEQVQVVSSLEACCSSPLLIAG